MMQASQAKRTLDFEAVSKRSGTEKTLDLETDIGGFDLEHLAFEMDRIAEKTFDFYADRAFEKERIIKKLRDFDADIGEAGIGFLCRHRMRKSDSGIDGF